MTRFARYLITAIKKDCTQIKDVYVMNKKGVAFIMVLIVALVIALASVALVKLTTYQYRAARIKMFRQEGFYLAEMGIQHALWRIRNNEDGTHIPPCPASPSCCSSGNCNLTGLAAGSYCTEHIDTSDAKWGPSSYTLDITYHKLVPEGGESTLSSDDKFRIEARVDYPGL